MHARDIKSLLVKIPPEEMPWGEDKEYYTLKAYFDAKKDDESLIQADINKIKTYLKTRWQRILAADQKNATQLARTLYVEQDCTQKNALNNICIHLAEAITSQKSAESKEVTPATSFYRVLMPTLVAESETDITYTVAITSLKPQQLFLTGDHTYLLSIDDILEYHQSSLILANPFTKKVFSTIETAEFERLLKTYDRNKWKTYSILTESNNERNAWIKLESLQRLLHLLNSYTDAYTAGEKGAQYHAATLEYGNFFRYYYHLPEDEREAMNRLRLAGNEHSITNQATLGILLADVSNQSECITHHIRAKLARLLKQFLPNCVLKDPELNKLNFSNLPRRSARDAHESKMLGPKNDGVLGPQLNKLIEAAFKNGEYFIRPEKWSLFYREMEFLNDQLANLQNPQPALSSEAKTQPSEKDAKQAPKEIVDPLIQLKNRFEKLADGPITERHSLLQSKTYKALKAIYDVMLDQVCEQHQLKSMPVLLTSPKPKSGDKTKPTKLILAKFDQVIKDMAAKQKMGSEKQAVTNAVR